MKNRAQSVEAGAFPMKKPGTTLTNIQFHYDEKNLTNIRNNKLSDYQRNYGF